MTLDKDFSKSQGKIIQWNSIFQMTILYTPGFASQTIQMDQLNK